MLVASGDDRSFRPHRNFGDVGRGLGFFVKSSWANVAEKSVS